MNYSYDYDTHNTEIDYDGDTYHDPYPYERTLTNTPLVEVAILVLLVSVEEVKHSTIGLLLCES